MSQEQSTVNYNCTICGYDFATYEYYKYHLKEHNRSLCNKCGENFESEEVLGCHMLSEHMKVHETQMLKDLIDSRSDEGNEIEIADEIEVIEESDAEGDEKSTKVENTPLIQVPGTSTNLAEQYIYECNVCHRLMMNIDYYNDHIERHAKLNERPFPCSACPSTFRTKKELQAHKNIHTDKFKCKICNQRFSCLKHLAKHELFHESSTPKSKAKPKRTSQRSHKKTDRESTQD